MGFQRMSVWGIWYQCGWDNVRRSIGYIVEVELAIWGNGEEGTLENAGERVAYRVRACIWGWTLLLDFAGVRLAVSGKWANCWSQSGLRKKSHSRLWAKGRNTSAQNLPGRPGGDRAKSGNI